MDGQLEGVADRLKDLGLDELEANVYLALLRNGPSNAGSIISLTEASRGTVYRVLSDLADRGIVTKTLSKPATYRAVEPATLFESSLEELERRREYLELLQERLQGPLETIASNEPPPAQPEWNVLEGRSSIYRRVRERCSEASSSIHIFSTHRISIEAWPVVEKAWQAVIDRAKAGAAVRVLSNRPEDLARQLDTDPLAAGVDLEAVDLDAPLHFVIVDDTEIVYWMVPSPEDGIHRSDDVAVHTDAPGLLDGSRLLFERFWEQTGAPVRAPDPPANA